MLRVILLVNGMLAAVVVIQSRAGGGNVAVVDRSAMISLSLSYSITDCACTGCIDQIEVGWVPGARLFCAYDNNPRCSTASTGTSTQMVTTPSSPGLYDLRFGLAQDYSCFQGGRTDWFTGAPSAAGRVGVICVR